MAITKKLKMNVDDENEMGEAVFENQDAANACNASDTLSFITRTLKALSICSCDLVGCEYYAIFGICNIVESVTVDSAYPALTLVTTHLL